MPDEQANRFTILPGYWYAAEFIGDEFCAEQEFRSYSAIRVASIRPAGNRHFSLHFYHGNYPEGVRDKVYSLQTLQRERHFILACSSDHTPKRLLLIYDISWPWLRLHLGVPKPNDCETIPDYLSRQL